MIPANYDFLNIYNGSISPSTIHARDNALTAYFYRYLFQKCVSVFDWKLPENWDLDYFLYVLYGAGYIGVLDTDEFGVIPQYCTFSGYNVFYQPKKLIVTNPAIKRTETRTIGLDGAVIKLTPGYKGVGDIVGLYAGLMSFIVESFGINLANSKVSYIFGSENKAAAETMKKAFDEMQKGNPAIFIDKSLFKEDGKPSWVPFTQNVREVFIAPELLELLQRVEENFDSDVGISSLKNLNKKERLITAEVEKTNGQETAKINLWLDNIRAGIKQVKDIFGINISCNFRNNEYNDTEEADDYEQWDTFDTGAL